MIRFICFSVLVFLLSGCSERVHEQTETLENVNDILPTLSGQLPVASSALYFKDITEQQLADSADYLAGAENSTTGRYISDILIDKPGQLLFNIAVPEDETIYKNLAGTNLPVAGLIFYPTSQDNIDEDTSIPLNVIKGKVVLLPKMQRSAEVKTIANATFPLVLFSHGFSANPFYDVQFFKDLASHGLVVLALFHGDLRFQELNQAQGLRALAFHQAIRELSDSPWAEIIDKQNVGLIGVSFGGSVAAILAGGIMNTVLDLKIPSQLAKVKSVVGLVPALNYGADTTWDFSSLSNSLFLVMAEKDENVLLAPTLELFSKHADTKVLIISLKDEGHFVSAEKWQIAQRLTLAKLKADLSHDTKSWQALDMLRKRKHFEQLDVVMPKP
ncbi:MAG: hypothetical protein ACI808_000852 [Paraglaciecola sp.]